MVVCGTLLAELNPLEEVVSKTLFTVEVAGYSIPFTNHMLMISVAAIVMMIVFPLVIKTRKLVPSGFYNAIETICVFIREDVVRPFLKDKTDHYIAYLWTIFFFILTMNLLGLVPLNSIIWVFTHKNNNFYGAPTANLFVTGALATFAFFLFHIAGIKQKGFKKYVKTFAPKVPILMAPFMYFMELVSSFVRLFSLALRLFANILAGHILLGVLLGFIVLFKNYMVASASIVTTTAMSLMEIFVAFLQAYIFTFLTAIYIGLAMDDH